jgi:hypothetical protein
MARGSEIRVYRGTHIWLDKRRSYEVVLDGQVVGELEACEGKSFDGSPGSHRVQVRVDDMASREVELTLEDGKIAELVCRARPGWAFFNVLLRGRPLHLMLRPARSGGGLARDGGSQ